MSLESVLEAIEASGEEQIDKIRAEARSEAQEILMAARDEAQAIRERELERALRSAKRKGADMMNEANLKRLKIEEQTRREFSEDVLASIRQRLQNIRSQPIYGDVLLRLVKEATQSLSSSLGEDETARLEIDSRDRDLIDPIVSKLKVNLRIVEGSEHWGGATLTSEDERVQVINTLEARMKQATPFLRATIEASLERRSQAE